MNNLIFEKKLQNNELTHLTNFTWRYRGLKRTKLKKMWLDRLLPSPSFFQSKNTDALN